MVGGDEGEGEGEDEDEDENEDEDEDEGEDQNGGETKGKKTRYVSGPLSEAGRKEAVELGKQTTDAFKALAAKHGKSSRTMMIASGLEIQNAHQRKNISNQFKRWYSATYPIAQGGKHSCILILLPNH